MTPLDLRLQKQRAYSAYGRVVLSDRPLAFEQASSGADSAIELIESPEDFRRDVPSSAQLIHDVDDLGVGSRLRMWRGEDASWIEYGEQHFCLDLQRSRIGYELPQDHDSPVDFEMMVERVVLPLYFMLENSAVIGVHGGSVVLGERAWIFVGESGAGKSTTARVTVERGAKLLADDLTLVDAVQNRVLPGCPSLRLWEEEGAIDLAIDDRPESKLRDKRWFRLASTCAVTRIVPIGGIFRLAPVESGAPVEHTPFERLTGQEAFTTLMEQTFDITDPESNWAMQRFRAVSSVARDVPVYRYSFARSVDGSPTHVEPLLAFISDLSSS